MNKKVEEFIRSTKQWRSEISKLREVMVSTELEEDFKWRLPCYTFRGSNVAIIQPFKTCLALMFFKGSLLKDPKGLLVDNGPNSQAGRRFEFHSVEDITKLSASIKSYIKEAIALEKAGLKVRFKKKPEPYPEELKVKFAKNPKLKAAFEALTPGRQRPYILHFSNAKQATTRLSRIEKCIPLILEGKGLHER